MKRYAAPGPPSERRRLKSARLSSGGSYLAPQYAFQPFLVEPGMGPDKIDLARANRLCSEYNQFLDFQQYSDREDLNDAGEKSDVVRHGLTIQKHIRELQQVVEEARIEVKSKCDEIEFHLDDFIIATARDFDKYPNGNLLSLDYHQLKELLPHLNIEDGEDFGSLVIDEAKECADLTIPEEELNGFVGEYVDIQQHILLDKLWLLVQELIDREQYQPILHALITLKASYRLSSGRFTEAQVETGHSRIDQLVKAFVADDITVPGGERSSVKRRAIEATGYKYSYNVDGVNWMTKGSCRTHWDSPLAVRTLRNAYFDKMANDAEAACGPRTAYENEICFHNLTIVTLEWLFGRAWSEIRGKVMLTIGTILPAELTERVFEYAILAEEIPADPSITEKVVVDPSARKGDSERSSRVKMKPRRSKKVRAPYWCAGLEQPRPARYGSR